MKIVINSCYGGFGLSPCALKLYYKKLNKPCYFFKKNYSLTALNHDGSTSTYEPVLAEELDKKDYWIASSIPSADREDLFSKNHISYRSVDRADPLLIEAIEEIGIKNAGQRHSKLKIIEIPDWIEYTVEEYDGMEHIAEKHRTWGII